MLPVVVLLYRRFTRKRRRLWLHPRLPSDGTSHDCIPLHNWNATSRQVPLPLQNAQNQIPVTDATLWLPPQIASMVLESWSGQYAVSHYVYIGLAARRGGGDPTKHMQTLVGRLLVCTVPFDPMFKLATSCLGRGRDVVQGP